MALLVIIVLPHNQRYRVIYCDVGQGDAILITAPNNIQILIDGGPDQRILEKLGKYMPFNDRTIETVMVTHPHADHLAGLLEVAQRYKIDRVIETDMPTNDALAEAWDGILSRRGISTIHGQTGQIWRYDDNLTLSIIYATERTAASVRDLNELSIVSEVNILGRKYLMTGDMTQAVEETILMAEPTPRVDVLKVAHHGSHFASQESWLKTIEPTLAIISVGQPNRYGHPAPEILTRLQQQGIIYWRTDQAGDIQIIYKNGQWVTRTEKSVML